MRSDRRAGGVARGQLLRRLDRAWTAFTQSYAGLSPAELLEPGVTGRWSVRDIIAHVTWWEEESLAHLPAILAGRTPPRYSGVYGGIDAFNALMTARTSHLSLAEVLERQVATHRGLVELVGRTPETALGSGTRWRRRLRLDTYGHYPKHARGILGWRDRRNGPRDGLPLWDAVSGERRLPSGTPE
jgi:hypothetical protein